MLQILLAVPLGVVAIQVQNQPVVLVVAPLAAGRWPGCLSALLMRIMDAPCVAQQTAECNA
jgi:hypothetical protein